MTEATVEAVRPRSPRLEYLPGLDGLRAVAVFAVVAYHLDLPRAVGGFLGVDLFFVISGYLITSLLVREVEVNGRVDLRSFWLRRVRRLVPPVVVMVAVTLLATRWWGLPEQWADVRADAVASIGYVANWWFVASDQSYFDSFLGPSPLRHMWSLAVEEQWYLLWPVVIAILGASIVSSSRRRAVTTFGFLGAAALSALWMAMLFEPGDPSRVYYGTDTRAQQLLVGAALAVGLPLVPRLARALSSPIALGTSLVAWLLVASSVTDEASWMYRGGLFAASVLAAALVAGVVSPAGSGVSSVLGSAPMRWLGRRSYGVYLWHWPVIVFVGAPMGLDVDGVPLMILQVAVTIGLAEASYRWVERPVRTSTRRVGWLALGWTTAGFLVAAGGLAVLATGDRRLPTETVIRPTPAHQRDADLVAAEASPVDAVSIDSFVPGDDGWTAGPVLAWAPPSVHEPIDGSSSLVTGLAAIGPRRMLLLGDSTALVAGQRLPERLGAARDWSVEAYAQLGCALSPGQTIEVGSDTPRVSPTACASWRDEWVSSVELVQPDVAVVMVGAWEVYDHVVDGRRLSFPDDEWYTHVEAAIAETVEQVAGHDRTVALLDVPCMQEVDSGIEVTTARRDDERVAALNAMLDRVAERSAATVVLPLGELLCPGGETARGESGEHLRYDGVHLSPEGVDLFWGWLLEEADALTG